MDDLHRLDGDDSVKMENIAREIVRRDTVTTHDVRAREFTTRDLWFVAGDHPVRTAFGRDDPGPVHTSRRKAPSDQIWPSPIEFANSPRVAA